MLSCKEVATQASEYLDSNMTARLRWQMRLHLMMCSHCRRFIRHIKLTQTIAQNAAEDDMKEVNSEKIYRQVMERVNAKNKE